MSFGRIGDVAAKSWPELCESAQFRFRQALSKIPYLPVPIRLTIPENQEIEFWWSRVVPYYSSERNFLDYWGQDAGDLRFLWRVLDPGMTFLDIGAHQGIFSVVAAAKLARSGRVIAFEPSPSQTMRLALHFRWNGLRPPESRVERLALGAHSGEQRFFEVERGGDTTRNGLRAPQSGDAVHEIAAPVMTLDRYAERRGISRMDVVKIDVEGGEIDLLHGASASLLRYRPILICELLDAATAPWGYPAREIASAVSELQYEWFDVNDDGRLSAHRVQTEYSVVRNYVALPLERSAAILRAHSA
jgi:FkbM family methyltransferase